VWGQRPHAGVSPLHPVSRQHEKCCIDDITYENFFKREGIGFIIRTSQIFLLIVNIDLQEIVQWIS
jgi:hypothetical protein